MSDDDDDNLLVREVQAGLDISKQLDAFTPRDALGVVGFLVRAQLERLPIAERPSEMLRWAASFLHIRPRRHGRRAA